MLRTRVGYAGGTQPAPTYRKIGDHSETIQLDYDPQEISYEQLLKIFWTTHQPTDRPYASQYRSIIFYHSEEQRRLAVASKRRQEDELGKKLYTQIVPAAEFYVAEDYHQKYSLRQNRTLMREFSALYPDPGDFLDSTAAARVNGYLAQYGDRDSLQTEIQTFGLSEQGRKQLLKAVGK